MAKKIFSKRTLAALLTLVMVCNLTGIGALAVQAEGLPLVSNPQDTYYKQDGSAGTADDWQIHLSKTAAPAEQDNVYNITLQVQTKNTETVIAGSTHGAAVLVLDVSNSMNDQEGGCTVSGCTADKNNAVHCVSYRAFPGGDVCWSCQQNEAAHTTHHAYAYRTQLDSLKAAVGGFLDSFAATAGAGEKRLVSVVVFGSGAKTIQSWIDVADASARANLKGIINALSTGDDAYLGNTKLFAGGTNMEGGLVLGRNLLKQDAVAAIPVENQSLILFSDGDPTASVSNANSTATDSIGYGGSDSGTRTDYADYDDISTILSGVSAAKIAVAYNYSDSVGVLKTPPFTRVLSSATGSLGVALQGEAGKVITVATNASTVTDPMGHGISLISTATGYDRVTQQWDLSQYTPAVDDGITTYTITYQVQIDPEAVAASSVNPAYTELTPANGRTTLDYTYGEDAHPVNVDFNVPSVRGIRSFTVRYEYVGQIPQGAPQLPAERSYKAGQSVKTAEAPVLENYTFSGWDKRDFTMPAADVVIRGSWSENAKYSYSVIYNANFGANEIRIDSENVSGIYAASYSISVDNNTFVRPNHTFVGWNTKSDGKGISYNAGQVIDLTARSNSVTLYAQWQENPKYDYSVIYNANNGTSQTKLDAQSVMDTYANTYIIGVDHNEFARDNYTFVGWAEEPEGQVVYQPGDRIFFAQSGSKILYAKWVEHNKYSFSLIYNGNGGILADGHDAYGDEENAEGIYENHLEITINENTFDRPGYTFIGWNTQADGSGVRCNAEGLVALTALRNTVTLYAQWLMDEPAPTEPEVTEPVPTEPAPTEPEVTEPVPTEPAPTEPEVTEPAPTEPEATEPAPTEPAAPAPVVDLPDEEVPLAPAPVPATPSAPLVELPDEIVPLADAPKTGDSMTIYMAMTALSGMGLLGLGLTKKKEEEN